MSVLGNLEIREERNAIVLRMHNRIDGHEGCWFTHDEIKTLIATLQSALKKHARAIDIRQQIDALQNDYEDLGL